MTTQTADRTATEIAKRRVYDAETALHAARQAGVDAWIAAAYEGLHRALLGYEAQLSSWLRHSRAA